MRRLATYEDFLALDIRTGRVLSATPLEHARSPAYRMEIDFGPQVGVKKSSARITGLYTAATLVGRLIVAVVNFPPKRVAGFESEVLVLGVPLPSGEVVLLAPDRPVPPGQRVF